MNELEKIIDGQGPQQKRTVVGVLQIKENAPWIKCADGTVLSVQASASHCCTPRSDTGPYSKVEVGYTSVCPPETWALHADGKYPSDVYGWVPVKMVREFVTSHGGVR